MNEEKVVEGEVVEETKVTEVKKGLLDKPKAFFEKHSGKIKAGALIVAGGVLGYVIGKRVGVNSVDTVDDNYDETDEDDSEDVEVTEF